MKKFAALLLPVALVSFFAGTVLSQEPVPVQTTPFSPARAAGSTSGAK